MTIPSEALKVCGKCDEEKKLEDFYKRTTGKPHSECKSCIKARNRSKRFGPNRENFLAKAREWTRKHRAKIKDKIKDEVFAVYGGYRCNCCGETERMFLTLDHINNDGGNFRKKELGKRTSAGYHSYQWLKRNDYPDDIQVLCMNCQHGKLMNNGICPHKGTCND